MVAALVFQNENYSHTLRMSALNYFSAGHRTEETALAQPGFTAGKIIS